MLSLPSPRFFILPALLAAGLAVASCKDDCDADVDCPASSNTVTAHVQTTLDVFTASTATYTVNGVPTLLTIAADAGAPSDDYDSDSDSDSGPLDLGDGWIVYKWVAPQLSLGDTFRLTITTSTGDSLLDVSQTLTSGPPSSGDGSECNYCAGSVLSEFDLYPTSKSGVSCDNGAVGTNVQLTGNLGDVPLTAASTFTLCLGSTCSTTPALAATATSDEGTVTGYSAQPAEGFRVTVDTDASGKGGSFTVVLDAYPEQLADGDMYSVRLDDGAVYSRQTTVKYDLSYPDGMACDAMPIKTANVQL